MDTVKQDNEDNVIKDNVTEEKDPMEQFCRVPFIIGMDKKTIWCKHQRRSKFSQHISKNVVKIFPRNDVLTYYYNKEDG